MILELFHYSDLESFPWKGLRAFANLDIFVFQLLKLFTLFAEKMPFVLSALTNCADVTDKLLNDDCK